MAELYCPTITYDPVTDPFGMKANHYQIERSPGDTFIHECGLDPATGFPTPFYQPDSIIVATAGAYKHQRFCYPGPRAGYAVFFGPRNEMNVYGGSVPKVRGHWMSVDRGECTAAAAALDSVLQMLERNRGLLPSGRKLRSVIIKTASEYMAKTVTDRIYTWVRNSWLFGTSRVKDWDLWEQLVNLMDEIQGRWQVDVRFWWVPNHWNLVARREARLGTQVPPPSAGPVSRSTARCSPRDVVEVNNFD